MITIFAPDGIGEVGAGADLAGLVDDAVAAHPEGPLRDGDLLVVTSKIISKAEGRTAPAGDREQLITAQSRRTVARRGDTRIVRTTGGLTIAAAGVDASNVTRGTVLLLPVDPDASAAGLRAELERRRGCRLGVVVSDTAGRAWREGQTDHAVGASGVLVLERYAGRVDPYGNELQVTATALADEVAAAADLVKGKLAGRPVAVVRGAGHLLSADDDQRAAAAIRPSATDMFGYGAREAVLAAVLAATGHPDSYEELLALDGADLEAAVVAGADPTMSPTDLLRAVLRAARTPPEAG